MSDNPLNEADSPDKLRAQLLAVEGLEIDKMNELLAQTRTMFAVRLSNRARIGWIVAAVISALLAIWGGLVLAFASDLDGHVTVIWWVYTAANVFMVACSGLVLWRGVFDVRWGMALAKLSPAASLFIALLLVMRAVSEPSLPALGWSVFGVVCLVVAIGITLYNRIVAAELANREHLLRLELRLLELAETSERPRPRV